MPHTIHNMNWIAYIRHHLLHLSQQEQLIETEYATQA